MSEKDEMTIDERRKYIHKVWGRYRNATKKEKGILLDEIEKITGMNRKSIIRVINGRLSRKKRTRERGVTYGLAEREAIKRIAHTLDYICAERLKPQLLSTAENLIRFGHLVVEEHTLEKLSKISVSTLKRILPIIEKAKGKIAANQPPKPRRNSIKEAYPMKRIDYKMPTPGHFETDLVLHCGDNLSGEYINTIQMTDVTTGWSEIEAVFGRSYRVMEDGFAKILDQLPFPVIEVHPDNGAEFFNHHLLKFWKEKIPDLELSRSRPYHKNDNRFVEENNGSLVRAYAGKNRLDTLEHLTILRTLYGKLRYFHNFFLPVMKTIEKVYYDEFHYRRVFDQPSPPLDRLATSGILSQAGIDKLFKLRDSIDLLDLRNQIAYLVDELYDAKPSSSNRTINIYETLRKEKDSSVTFLFEPSIPVR